MIYRRLLYMSKPKVVGEGTYGCVHDPALKCDSFIMVNGKPLQYKNKVSKILHEKYARLEMDEYLGIQRADPHNQFFLGVPIQCKPLRSGENYTAVKQCSKGAMAVDELTKRILPDFNILLMENGGMNLRDFALKMEKAPATPENQRIMERFWIEAHRLFLGLSVFKQENIMHHDLKAQNIVYNPQINRVAFIDFGLMRPATAQKNRILSQNDKKWSHWSYPVEAVFYNKSFYASPMLKEELLKEVFEGLDLVFEEAFLNNILPDNNKDPKHALTRKGTAQMLYNDYVDMVNNSQFIPYDEFLDKSLETFDLYGMCMGLLYVFKKTNHLIRDSKIDYYMLYQILYFCVTPNINIRFEVDRALSTYEHLLADILREDHIIFDNHIPTKIAPPPHLAVPKMSNAALVKSMEEKDSKLLAKMCPPGKVLNPFTGRCVKECRAGQQRDERFRCRSVKVRAHAPAPVPKDKTCPETKDLNPHTNRCVAKCKPGHVRDGQFKCRSNKTKKTKSPIPKILYSRRSPRSLSM